MPDFVVTAVEDSVPRRSRTLAERLMLRFPLGWRLLAAAGTRLISPRARVRRAFLQRNMISAYAAANRRDFELMLLRYSPHIETEFDPEFEPLGLGGTFRGHEGVLRMIASFSEAWEHWELRPEIAIDLGDRLVGLGRFDLPGTASGIGFEREFAQLVVVRRGVVVREWEFLSWDKGLRAAGLDPTDVGLPVGGASGAGS